MSRKKIIILASTGLAIVLMVSIGLFLYSRERLVMPVYTAMSFNEKMVKPEDIIEINRSLANLTSTKFMFYNKPDFVIKGFKQNNSANFDEYAVFINDGLVYRGNYLDAWTDRMSDRYSLCYSLTPESKQRLLKLQQHYK